MIIAAAVVGSGFGALARYGMAGMIQRRMSGARPWGTAAVNVLGAVLLGLLTGLHASGTVTTGVLTVAGTGFLGGFTTFSTWMVESVRLAEEGGVSGLFAAAANLGAMLIAGIAGIALSMTVT